MDININDIKYDVYVGTTLIDGLSRKGELIRAYKLIRKFEKYSKIGVCLISILGSQHDREVAGHTNQKI